MRLDHPAELLGCQHHPPNHPSYSGKHNRPYADGGFNAFKLKQVNLPCY
jgi:hypothetical protein